MRYKKETHADPTVILRGEYVLFSKDLFIKGNKERAGILFKSYYTFRHKKYDANKIDVKRMSELNDIFEMCLKENYLVLETGADKNIYPTKGKSFDDMHGIAKLIHHEYYAISGFWKVLMFVVSYIVAINYQPMSNLLKDKYNQLINSLYEQRTELPQPTPESYILPTIAPKTPPIR